MFAILKFDFVKSFNISRTKTHKCIKYLINLLIEYDKSFDNIMTRYIFRTTKCNITYKR